MLYRLSHQGSPLHSFRSYYNHRYQQPHCRWESGSWRVAEHRGTPGTEALAPHSSTLSCWRIPWTEEPGGLQSVGVLRVGHDGATSLSLFTSMHWRRPLQCSCLENPRDSGAWWAAVYGVAQSRTRLKRVSRAGTEDKDQWSLSSDSSPGFPSVWWAHIGCSMQPSQLLYCGFGQYFFWDHPSTPFLQAASLT